MPAKSAKRIPSKAELKVVKALKEIEASASNEFKENLKGFRILTASIVTVDANKKALAIVYPLILSKLLHK